MFVHRGRKPAHLSSNEETRLKHMKKCLRAAGLSVEHRDLFTADKCTCTHKCDAAKNQYKLNTNMP